MITVLIKDLLDLATVEADTFKINQGFFNIYTMF